MTSNNEQIKQLSVRWPESFWDAAKIAAHKQRISLQRALTLGCAAYLGIEPPAALDGEDEPETVTAPPDASAKKRRAS